jgi:ATP-dependent exoDNAse (exonuclease V) alpha subunit
MKPLYKEQSTALIECAAFIINYQHTYQNQKKNYLRFAAKGGTGKTYTLNQLCTMLEGFGLYGIAVAFTGRAVSHLSKAGMRSSTFHKLMKIPIFDEDGDCVGFENKPFEEILSDVGDFIVLDESSMIPSSMFYDITNIGVPVIKTGDVKQLPPIDNENPGFNSMELPVDVEVNLLTNRRTDAEFEGILKISDQFRESNAVPRFFKGNGVSLVKKGMALSRSYLEENQFDMVGCGTNKTRRRVNEIIRDARGYHTEIPQVGETVVCLKNHAFQNGDYIANGELFEVLSVMEMKEDSILTVKSIDLGTVVSVKVLNEFWSTEKMPKMSREQRKGYHEFAYGYCLSVWKCQGSSFDRFLFIDEDISFFGDQQKFRYTAVSRAAKKLVYTV